MWKVSVFAALLVAAAPPALAANPDLRRGLKLYDDLDYLPALDALQAADARPDSTRKEKVEIQLYIGIISIALGDEGKARAAFAKAIALDHRARAPNGASPKVAAILEQLRAEAPTEVAPEPTPLPQPQQPAVEASPQQPQPVNPYPYGSPYYAQQPQGYPPQAPPPQPGAPYASSASPPVDSGSSSSWSAITGFTALGLGAVGVVVGVVFQLQANSDVTTGNGEPTAAAALTDQASANQAWTYTLVGYVAGGVLLVGGLTLVIVHYAAGPSHPAEPHAGEVSLTPRGVALSF